MKIYLAKKPNKILVTDIDFPENQFDVVVDIFLNENIINNTI